SPGTVLSVADPYADVFANPAFDSEIVATVVRGSTVTVTRDLGEWIELAISDRSGFVHRAALRTGPDQTGGPTSVASDAPAATQESTQSTARTASGPIVPTLQELTLGVGTIAAYLYSGPEFHPSVLASVSASIGLGPLLAIRPELLI